LLVCIGFVSNANENQELIVLPVLKPDLDRALCHVYFLCYPLSYSSCGSGVFVEFHL
jgi:hypothetical protein